MRSSFNSSLTFFRSVCQWSWTYIEHVRKICLQYLSLCFFIITFMYLALMCSVLCVYLVCHMFKLTYEISQQLKEHNLDVVAQPREIYKHPELLYNLGFLLIEWILVSSYLIHWYRDWGIQDRGSRPIEKFRYLPTWKYIADYFPIRMVLSRSVKDKTIHERLSDKLDKQEEDKPEVVDIFSPHKNYLVGYHPHGIFGLGAFINFGTEANQFSKRFPGIKAWLTTLEINFKAPIQRDFMLSSYTVAATYNGIMHLLDPKRCGHTGNFVVVVLGGAQEALDSRPTDYVFHLNKRYGFFKIALLTGSHLVPCVSFGEPNMYKQVWNPKGSWLRTFQERFTKRMTFSLPLFYAKLLMPYRKPVTTVIGDPIPVEKNENPTREEVAALKERYCKALKDLFDEFKPIFDPDGKHVVFV